MVVEGGQGEQILEKVALAGRFSRLVLLVSRDAYWGYENHVLGDFSLNLVPQVHNLHCKRS